MSQLLARNLKTNHDATFKVGTSLHTSTTLLSDIIRTSELHVKETFKFIFSFQAYLKVNEKQIDKFIKLDLKTYTI